MKTLFSRRAACSEGTALMVVAALLTYLIVTKRSESYMNPVLIPFVVAMAAVFLFWGFSRILRATPTRTRSYAAAATLGMIAVLLAGPAIFGIMPESPADRLEQNEGGEVTPFGIDFEHIQGDGIDDNKRQVVIGSNNWYTTIFKLTKYVDKYAGYEVYITGFVSFYDDSLKRPDFTISRYLMICCVNDMSPFGLPCILTDGQEYGEYRWIAVKGKIEVGDYHGMKRPVLKVEEIRQAAKTVVYVYPYR